LSVEVRIANKSSRGQSSIGYEGQSKSQSNSTSSARKIVTFIIECYKLKNKEKRTDIYRKKGKSNDEGNGSIVASKGR
jgi:hypothetical protein